MRFGKDKILIRNLIAIALLALVLAPLVSLHQLGAIEARASVRIVEKGAVRTVTFEAVLAATRL
jgi:hypothetical protein